MNLLLALTLTAASVPPTLAPPSDWVEYRTAHFILRSNSSEVRVGEILKELGALRVALIAGIWHGINPSPDLAEVVAFDQRDSIHEITDFWTDAVAHVDGRVELVQGGTLMVADRAMAGNEGFNLAERILLTRPLWVLMGLDMFGQTVTFAEDGSTATFGLTFEQYGHGNTLDLQKPADAPHSTGGGGGPHWNPSQSAPPNSQAPTASRVSHQGPGGVLWSLSTKGRLPAARLFAFTPNDYDKGEDYTGQFNMTSWLTIHYLMDNYQEALRDYLMRLGRGEPRDQAWQSAFPSLTADQLDQNLGVYLNKAVFGAFQVKTGSPTVEILSKETLSDSEVHGMTAQLYLDLHSRRTEDDRRSRAADEVKQALDKDPAAVSALEVKARADPQAALPLARTATVTYAKDARAWALLGQLSSDPGEKTRAWTTAVSLDSSNPRYLRELASDDVGHGLFQQGLPLAGKALGSDPGDARTLDVLADALIGMGNHCKAKEALVRAVNVAPREHADQIAHLQAKVSVEAARCGPASATSKAN